MEQELRAKKYAELRILAKEAGIKANLKTEKLIQALLEYHSNSKDDDENCITDQQDDEHLNKSRRGTYELDSTKNESLSENTSESFSNDETMLSEQILSTCDISNNQTPKRKELLKKSIPIPVQREMPKSERKSEKKSEIRTVKGNRNSGSKIPKVKRNAISKVKTPNFARIHQKQFEKMESLNDYVDKKNKLLALSANKNSKTSIRNNFSTPSSSKKVDVMSKNKSNIKSHKKVAFGQLKSHPISKLKSPATKLKMFDSKKMNFNFQEKKFKLQSPVIKFTGILKERNSNGFKFNSNITPALPKKKVMLREKHNSLKNHSQDSNKFREKQREYIKGVRTNKRFELQMKMRVNKEA